MYIGYLFIWLLACAFLVYLLLFVCSFVASKEKMGGGEPAWAEEGDTVYIR